MNNFERRVVGDFLRQARRNKNTRYEAAWSLVEKYPHLAVAIVTDYFKVIENASESIDENTTDNPVS